MMGKVKQSFVITALIFFTTSSQAMLFEWHRDRQQNQAEFLTRLIAVIPHHKPLKLSIFFYKSDGFGTPQRVLLKDYQGWGINYGSLYNWAPDLLDAMAKNLKSSREIIANLWSSRVNASFLFGGGNYKYPQLVLFINVPDSEERLGQDVFVPYDDLGVWIDRNDLLLKKYVNTPGDFDRFLPMLLSHNSVVAFLVSPHRF